MSKPAVALITGANSGIGLAVVKRLAQNPSYHVLLASRSLENGQQALAEVQEEGPRGKVTHILLDVTKQASIDEAVKTVENDFGVLDILINNAGISAHGSLKEQLESMLATNTIAPALVTEAFTPLLLRSSNPRLVHVSSGMGSMDLMLNGTGPEKHVHVKAYQMSKSALNMCAVEDHRVLGPQGVKVWALCPGFVTSNLRGAGMDKVQEPGALSPSVPAQFMHEVLEGKRDADVGKFIHRNGIYGW